MQRGKKKIVLFPPHEREREKEREGWREGGRDRERGEGERKNLTVEGNGAGGEKNLSFFCLMREREGVRERERDRGRETRREGWREGGRKGERESGGPETKSLMVDCNGVGGGTVFLLPP